jgi:hypothetical protein
MGEKRGECQGHRAASEPGLVESDGFDDEVNVRKGVGVFAGEETVDAHDERSRGALRSGLYGEEAGGCVLQEDGAKGAVVVRDCARGYGECPVLTG